jgi:hypothetical protein
MKKFYSLIDFINIKSIAILSVVIVLMACSRNERGNIPGKPYYIAAYIWPSCHDDEMGRSVLWPDGTGEWEIIKKGTPRFEGHYQPKIPLWGYEMDNDPHVMEKWIDAATDHGVNVFIFDWYWYDGGPFLESSLNDGFLKASNNWKMQFYVMWANHDVRRNYWNVHKYQEDTTFLWRGAVSPADFKIIVDRIINQYFTRSNYFKIDGKPVFSLFNMPNFIKSFKDEEEARAAMDYFRTETIKAGFPGLHLQVLANGAVNSSALQSIELLGANSATKYNWGGPHREDYMRYGTEALERQNKWDSALSIPLFPNASIGWDDTPRFPHKTKEHVVHYNNTPGSFAGFLQKAKEYCDNHPEQPALITVFAWNEWIEGAYLLPDVKYGFEYLEAVKKVMNGEYNKYSK